MVFENRADIWPKFEKYTAYSYFELLKKIHHQNAFSERIRLYNEKKRSDQSRPLSQGYIEENKEWLPVQNVRFMEDAKETYEAAMRASPHVKPILYHYSWHSFFAFLMYTFARYDSHAGGHGISVDIMSSEQVILEFHPFKKRGYFQRILDTLTILGYPLAFARWIPIEGEGQGVVFEENKASSIADRKEIDLIEIATFDAIGYMDRLWEKHECFQELGTPTGRYHGTRFHWVNQWIIDFIMLFTASSIARYKPYVWHEILQGTIAYTSKILTKVRTAYEGYLDFVNYVYGDILERYR